jgi:hypothetical protein
MRFEAGLIATCLLLSPLPASAKTEETVDIGDIKTVAGLIMQAGYRAEIKKNKAGDTYIASAANGSEFSVNFYGCKADVACESLEFQSWYKKQPYFTADLTNEWNAKKRLMKIAVDGDGDLVYYVYLSAIGHTTFKNFADYLDWFATMDAELAKFLDTKKTASDAVK